MFTAHSASFKVVSYILWWQHILFKRLLMTFENLRTMKRVKLLVWTTLSCIFVFVYYIHAFSLCLKYNSKILLQWNYTSSSQLWPKVCHGHMLGKQPKNYKVTLLVTTAVLPGRNSFKLSTLSSPLLFQIKATQYGVWTSGAQSHPVCSGQHLVG